MILIIYIVSGETVSIAITIWITLWQLLLWLLSIFWVKLTIKRQFGRLIPKKRITKARQKNKFLGYNRPLGTFDFAFSYLFLSAVETLCFAFENKQKEKKYEVK